MTKLPRISAYTAAVFLVSFAMLSWDISRDGIAAAYSDPIAQIRAQDESVYVNASIRMAQDGDWLTPKVMGRLFFQKPPMLMWLSALSIRLFGLSLFAVRLPALVLGAAGVAAVFAWCARARSVTAGVAASAFLLMCPIWQTLSRLCYTDVLAGSLIAAALTAVAFDPGLEKRTTRIAFGAFSAAAILSKSVAGLLPCAVLAVFEFAAPPKFRLKSLPLLKTAPAFLAVAAPWHIYQAIVHPQWFWADYVELELLGIGLHAQRNGVFNRSPLFYLQRLMQMDPLLTLFAAAGFIGAIRAMRSRDAVADLLPLCWMGVTILALCLFQAKNLPYLALLLPPMCVLGAVSSPRFLDRRARMTALVLAALLLVKLSAGSGIWSWRVAAPPLQAAQAMRMYSDLRRDAELIAVNADDEYYSATLPLPRIRYCFLDPAGSINRAVPYYATLGITLTAAQFVNLPALLPTFREHLRQWGVDSEEPIGSAIVLSTPSDLSAIVHAHPESDFYAPSAWNQVIADAEKTHQVLRFSPTHVFLLSRRARQRTGDIRAIPAHW